MTVKKERLLLKILLFIYCFLSVIVCSCASSDKSKEQTSTNFEEEKKTESFAKNEEIRDLMLKYLVDPDDYTTKGAEFHIKYIDDLKHIAYFLSEQKQIIILEHSIGFYYDKREDRKDKLYLGIDIFAPAEAYGSYTSYQDIAMTNIRKYLWDILNTFQVKKDIFSEPEIIGSVVSIKWEWNSSPESVTIWVDNRDVLRFKNLEITFNELIQRNYITNTKGKIIKLLL